MAVALAFSGTMAVENTVTGSLTGATATTAYTVVLSHPSGAAQNVPIKTDGTGAATFTFVPVVAGTHTANVYLATPTSIVTATTTAGGHGR